MSNAWNDGWVVRPKKGKFLKTFEPQTEHGVWCPGFEYVSPGMACSHDCIGCFMHRIRRRFNRPNEVYSNVAQLRAELSKWLDANATLVGRRLLCFGTETTDIIADRRRFVDAWGIAPEDLLVEAFSGREADVLVLTKSADLAWWLARDPLPNVVLSASVNGLRAAERWERGTPAMATRLRALEAVMRLGWRVRVRVDPLITQTPDFSEDVRGIAEWIRANPVERVTVGVRRHNKTPVIDERAQVEAVEVLLEHLGDRAAIVGPCKLSVNAVRLLGLHGRPCNCLP